MKPYAVIRVGIICAGSSPLARQPVLIVNRQGVGFVDGKMVDEAIARKARLILERAGIAAEDQVVSSSSSKEMKNK